MRLLYKESQVAAAGDALNFTFKNAEMKMLIIKQVVLAAISPAIPTTNYPAKFYIEKYDIGGTSITLDVVYTQFQALNYIQNIALAPHEIFGVRVIDRGALTWVFEVWGE